jgi:hypothetical protein
MGAGGNSHSEMGYDTPKSLAVCVTYHWGAEGLQIAC